MKVGVSSLKIMQEATFDLPKEQVVEETHNVLLPEVEINERTAPGR